MKQRLPSLTVFLGSFLLFGVQPMLGRTLLPSFGGTAAVWTVCLAAYQTLLLAGYFYAHVMSRRPRRTQAVLHTGFLALAVVWTAAFAFWRPALKGFIGNSGTPALEVLFCVLVFAGLPYVLLSAGSTLVQAWLAGAGERKEDGGRRIEGSPSVSGLRPQASDSRNVYRLYAVSNLGSFAGLLVYPFLLEPYVSLTAQWWGFAVCLAGYAVLLAALARQPDGDDTTVHPSPVSRLPSPVSSWLWFALPAVSVFLLNAVTAHLTLDVMPLPLLWVVLLGLFLLSYVAGFSGRAERHLPWLQFLAVLSVLFAVMAQKKTGPSGGFALNLAACLGLCFFGATFLHAWLYSLRPHAGRLTLYYLGNAAGGAVGGLLASLVAPVVFKSVAEFPIALVLVLAAGAYYVYTVRIMWVLRAAGMMVACGALLAFGISMRPKPGDRPVVWRDRGFFGTLQVFEAKARTAAGEGVIHEFVHGNTVHGIQALIPGKERMPTTYFTPQSGGYAVMSHPKYRTGEPMRVNILGLGVGVMLCYARTNDYYRCYEISPQALRVAQDPAYFTFASGCPGRLKLVCQDARKGLEQELAAGVEPYDVIQIDAFTGDNLPYHLSTREAFELYFKMLKPDGVLAVNISNWHLSLEPFIKAVGGTFQCPVLGLSTPNDFGKLGFAAKFAFFCRRPEKLSAPPKGATQLDFQRQPHIEMPTDEKGSFVNAIKWK